ncbi:Uu.00g050290.m01.CDS01 [Anthostomella pinea]|uniref:Uu.00g050290.m01.CDS01 n=1 Tax=Anthostomella pinea TaxID=933095 RepID=A0AAI8VSM7_9PEZI|nr:Uu.00g050290.m01.CDS01 [Anthostomella pinea]
MAFKSATALALLGASSVDALIRKDCRGSTGLARMDPIMDAGTVSSHVYTMHIN